MTWASEKPTQEGYYWFRWSPGHIAEIRRITKMDCGCFYHDMSWVGAMGPAQWSGPLTPPGEVGG